MSALWTLFLFHVVLPLRLIIVWDKVCRYREERKGIFDER